MRLKVKETNINWNHLHFKKADKKTRIGTQKKKETQWFPGLGAIKHAFSPSKHLSAAALRSSRRSHSATAAWPGFPVAHAPNGWNGQNAAAKVTRCRCFLQQLQQLPKLGDDTSSGWSTFQMRFSWGWRRLDDLVEFAKSQKTQRMHVVSCF